MRKPIDKDALANICSRFLEVSEKHLGLSMKGLAKKLGYKNQSTLTKVRKKIGFIGPDKLKTFGSLKNSRGESPNIHFIITGMKPMFIGEKDGVQNEEVELLSRQLIKKLGVKKSKELLAIITSENISI